MDVDLARSLYIALVNVGCAYVYNGFRAADLGDLQRFHGLEGVVA
jgi:hypothetical protein